MAISAQSGVERGICKLSCGSENATAFLISNNQIITATHAIQEHYDSEKEIQLEFKNICQEVVYRSATPLEDEPSSPISILQLDIPIDGLNFPNFCNKKVKKDDEFEIFGYPVAKSGTGHWLDNKIIRRIEEDMQQPYDWDIDLNHDSVIDDFSGLSGSPLFVDSRLVGVVLTQSIFNGKAVSLGAISVSKFNDFLEDIGIEVEKSIEYNKYLIHRLAEDVDYSNSMFIAMLESANIYDHEYCQEEFFNAEIAKSSVESKVVNNELNQFLSLKYDVHGVWRTMYRKYKNEHDGNELLADVYERVEDLSESALKGEGLFSLTIKKGLLHQLADENELGWVKNYKNRVIEYLGRGKESD